MFSDTGATTRRRLLARTKARLRRRVVTNRLKSLDMEAAIAQECAAFVGKVMNRALVAIEQTEAADEGIKAAISMASSNGEAEHVRRALELHDARASEAVVEEAHAMLRAALHPPVAVGVEVGDEDVTDADVVVLGVWVQDEGRTAD